MIMLPIVITMFTVGGVAAFILDCYADKIPKWLEPYLVGFFLVGLPGGLVVGIVSLLTWMWMLALS